MKVPGLNGEVENLGLKKLNGRSDFIGKLHNKLSWGWELWTKDGYDVITLSALQTRAFNIRSGDWIVIFDNRVWVPYTAYRESGVAVIYAKFKVGEHTHHMLALADPRTKEHCYTSISAVYAHTVVELDIRPVLADKQRKAWVRWVDTKPVRARLPLTDLTTAKTDVIDRFVSRYSDEWHDRYVLVGYSSYGGLEIQLRLAFAHLRTNSVLRYLWNKHHYCGLRYLEVYPKVGALYNDQLCIVSVGRCTADAQKADRWLSSLFPETVLGIQIEKPITNLLITGCINESESSIN